MTRIAIFCDGTWNSPTIPEPTHVHKLQRAVIQSPERGQVSVYFPGVGTDDRFDGRIKRFFNKWGGGAFGWGLEAKVKQAYQFIAQAYGAGDEIYLFGFSRGAFTARSIAGMIRKCGIVEDTSPEGINKAYALYRKRGARNHPDAPHIQTARAEMSPKFATSEADLTARGATGAEMVKIAYLGVWDTVGARGLPLAMLGPVAALWNSRYKFHDMALSSLVRSARHAVAVDEMRVFYRPALWDNLTGAKGLNKGRDDDPLRPYQQIWFAGNHGVVGGSSEAQALAAIPLMWIMEGAGRLVRDPEAVLPPTPPDALQPTDAAMPQRGWFKAWRKGPGRAQDIHISVRDRFAGMDDYRPGSLRSFLS